MLRTIKRVKEMRLDELIKYVWDNGIEDMTVKSKTCDKQVIFEQYKLFLEEGINEEDVFEITCEEPITEDTKFDTLVKIYDKIFVYYGYDMTIREFKGATTNKIFVLIDGDLQLVWERDVDE